MIVEDETLLAMELESEIEMAGHRVTGTAMNREQARNLTEAHRPDLHLSIFIFRTVRRVSTSVAIWHPRHSLCICQWEHQEDSRGLRGRSRRHRETVHVERHKNRSRLHLGDRSG